MEQEDLEALLLFKRFSLEVLIVASFQHPPSAQYPYELHAGLLVHGEIQRKLVSFHMSLCNVSAESCLFQDVEHCPSAWRIVVAPGYEIDRDMLVLQVLERLHHALEAVNAW